MNSFLAIAGTPHRACSRLILSRISSLLRHHSLGGKRCFPGGGSPAIRVQVCLRPPD
ncbi:hypothetical protein [Coleofasciculus sp. FACHB-1120]|uniref:hypothetical protein n=1 Tax=Coleofasciculus sp. FACHB-1120 TaxID=2692783 RepID=UPI0019A8DF5D|nr:hypothetical protein [Coleofasciculus sp. FACHB-1120]MBD2744691.1 hypothetical protein [Coleofasciculus sp. FACHB-1120]